MYVRFTSESGKREKWTIEIRASLLLECCKERMDYHSGRVSFWDKERVKAETQLREKGIQLKHFDVTGGQRMEAQLDQSLARRVTECEGRSKSNKDAVAKFRSYQSMLKIAGDNSIPLNVDDVLYFNLENADTENDGDSDGE